MMTARKEKAEMRKKALRESFGFITESRKTSNDLDVISNGRKLQQISLRFLTAGNCLRSNSGFGSRSGIGVKACNRNFLDLPAWPDQIEEQCKIAISIELDVECVLRWECYHGKSVVSYAYCDCADHIAQCQYCWFIALHSFCKNLAPTAHREIENVCIQWRRTGECWNCGKRLQASAIERSPIAYLPSGILGGDFRIIIGQLRLWAQGVRVCSSCNNGFLC